MQQNIIFVDFQFVVGNGGQYFIKEMATLKQGSLLAEFYLFKAPYPKQELSYEISHQNEYNRKNINGLDWEIGTIEYNNLLSIFKNLETYTIFVKGKEKKAVLVKYLPNTTKIVDIGFDMPKLSELQNYTVFCTVHTTVQQNTKRCALKNCFNMYMYMLKHNKIDF